MRPQSQACWRPSITPHHLEARIDRATSRKAIDTLLRLRKGTKLGPAVTVRNLIDKGRR